MQLALMHDSFNDALREAIHAIGGPKKLGALLWPEQPVDHASNKVRDCLNPDRRERFSPDQVLMILRLARQAGCHSAAAFLMREAGYADPVPVDPEDEVVRLQREFVEATKALGHLAQRIEATQALATKRPVVKAA